MNEDLRNVLIRLVKELDKRSDNMDGDAMMAVEAVTNAIASVIPPEKRDRVANDFTTAIVKP